MPNKGSLRKDQITKNVLSEKVEIIKSYEDAITYKFKKHKSKTLRTIRVKNNSPFSILNFQFSLSKPGCTKKY